MAAAEMRLVVDDHRDALISPASWTFPQTALRADPHATVSPGASRLRRGTCQYYLAQSLDGYIAEEDGGLDWLLQRLR